MGVERVAPLQSREHIYRVWCKKKKMFVSVGFLVLANNVKLRIYCMFVACISCNKNIVGKYSLFLIRMLCVFGAILIQKCSFS